MISFLIIDLYDNQNYFLIEIISYNENYKGGKIY